MENKELDNKINIIKSDDSKKKDDLITIQASNNNEKGKKDDAAAEMEINIEEILNDLRRDICRVYSKTKNIEMELQTAVLFFKSECVRIKFKALCNISNYSL